MQGQPQYVYRTFALSRPFHNGVIFSAAQHRLSAPLSCLSPFYIPRHLSPRFAPAVQQQFFHNFSFTNSQYFHRLASDFAPVKDDSIDGRISPEVISDSTQEQKILDMQARGIKRLPDFQRQASPEQKRARPQSEPSSSRSNKSFDASLHSSGQREIYAKISDYVWSHSDNGTQLQRMYLRKMKLRDAIYAILKEVFPYCGLYIVGSSMNGFGDVRSDMDLCLMLSHNQIDQKKEATEILTILQYALSRCRFLQQVQVIRAKVPILRFVDKFSAVECDLNINNSVGIRNTHLLYAYSQMDPRIVPLVVMVKRWAKAQDINDASKGTISSYSLVLMVIHYLQCGCSIPVIPSLQQKYPLKFNGEQDIRMLTLNEVLPAYKSPNTQSIGELFLGFLEYYAYRFDFQKDCISVRLGRKISKSAAMAKSQEVKHFDGMKMWKCLCIEEPYDFSNTARSVYDDNTFHRIHRVIRSTYNLLRNTGDVTKILEAPV